MSKSVYAIGGMGVAGCLMLSFMMQHLLKVKQDRTRSPVADELQELFAGRLVGPVQVEIADEQGVRTMTLRMTMADGDPRQIVKGAGGMAWRKAASLPDAPQRLRMEVRGKDDEAPAVIEFNARGIGTMPKPGAPKGSPSGPPPPDRPATPR